MKNGTECYQRHSRWTWKEVWTGTRSRKKAAFLWSIYHRVVVVNQWRHQDFAKTSDLCLCCEIGEPESILQCFLNCRMVVHAWSFAMSVLHAAARTPILSMPWRPLSWEQCVFGKSLPLYLQQVSRSWTFIRGAVLWILWIQRNQFVFHNHIWPPALLEQGIWDAVIDLGRTATAKIDWCERHQPQYVPHAIRELNVIWNHAGVFFLEGVTMWCGTMSGHLLPFLSLGNQVVHRLFR